MGTLYYGDNPDILRRYLKAERVDLVVPEQKDQATETTDFELVTWLVIKKP